MADFLERLRNTLANRYRLERELGRGGMATVYLAEDLKHHRPVAIKVLDPTLAGLLGPERFVREIETAARLQHPHILPLLDSGADHGLFFYVMPYVEGDSLRSHLAHARQLSQEEAARLVAEVARALDYAHRQGIVHRDIKPENILLADGHAVVADFGIATAIRSSGGEKLTRSGVTVGTPPYMSPEQIAGQADVDGRSDLYSLGCVLYELLAGQAPFTGPAETLAHQHMNLTPRPIRDLRPTVSAELSSALERALAKTPADRFSTGADFAAALAGGSRTATTATVATTPTPGGGAAPFPYPSASTTPAPDRPGTEGVGATQSPADARVGTATPVAAPRRIPRGVWVSAGLLVAAVAAVLLWRARARDVAPGGGGDAHRRWVWLADFEGSAGDASLAPAARDLVAASFDESKVIATVPAEQTKIALRNSGRPDTVRIDPALARELAYRSAIPVVVEGSIGAIGSAYSIVLRATNAEDGRLLETATAQASSERELVPVLTRLARQMRQALGERPEAFRGTESWADAPTPSFEAFKLYRRGRELIYENDDWGSLPLFRQALAIDPEFATAWVYLGTAHGNLGNFDSAYVARAEALRHPHRLTPARRLYIEAANAWAQGDAAAAVAAYDAILELDPSPVDRMAALSNKAGVLSDQGQLEAALATYREATHVVPFEIEPIQSLNIANTLLALNRRQEARAQVASLSTDQVAAFRMDLDFIERRWKSADSLATVMSGRPTLSPVLRARFGLGRAAVRVARGEFENARRQLDALSAGLDATRNVGVMWFVRESLSRHLGQPAPEIPAPIRGTGWGAAARAKLAAQSGDSVGARAAVASWPGPEGRVVNDFIESCLDGRQGRWQPVIARLGPHARRGIRGIPNVERTLRPSMRWLMADAFENLAQPDSAAAYLDLILSPPAYEPPSVPGIGAWEPFVRARLVRLFARAGRIEDARRQWEILSETCTAPDPEALALLDETRSILRATEGMRGPERR